MPLRSAVLLILNQRRVVPCPFEPSDTVPNEIEDDEDQDEEMRDKARHIAQDRRTFAEQELT